MSATFWTPIHVARRAAELLVTKPNCRVLDIGSGSGKFCIVGALTKAAHFTGVEQRASLVECAREVAAQAEIANVSFVHGLFGTLNPEDFDAFYIFNPFEENKFAPNCQFDWSVPLAKERFEEDVQKAQAFLRAARPGTRVVTYNGMGGSLPWTYDLVEREQLGCTLELWVKDAQGKRDRS